MNHLRSEAVHELPQIILEEQQQRRQQQSSVVNISGNQHDVDSFQTDSLQDDQQAQIRRRAPTRHSIKSLTGRKALSKQNSANEVK